MSNWLWVRISHQKNHLLRVNHFHSTHTVDFCWRNSLVYYLDWDGDQSCFSKGQEKIIPDLILLWAWRVCSLNHNSYRCFECPSLTSCVLSDMITSGHVFVWLWMHQSSNEDALRRVIALIYGWFQCYRAGVWPWSFAVATHCPKMNGLYAEN